MIAQHLSVLAAVCSHIEHAIDAEIGKQTAQMHPLVDQMKLLAGNDKITDHRSNIRLRRRLSDDGMVQPFASTNQLDIRSQRSNRGIVNTAPDDLGDELVSTNFARAMSSILE